ncbi:MAG: MOSC N-terminal beta barrel domain-containing protein [Pseudomonadota bacterium]
MSMAARLAEIWRHPIKGVGAERVASVAVAAGQTFPWDRTYAIAHGASDWDPAAPAWIPRRNFVVQARVAELVRAEAALDETSGTLTLSHPAVAPVTLAPGTAEGDAALTGWIGALAGEHQPGPYRIAHLPGQALTDMEPPYVSILSRASLRALGQHLGVSLSVRRFRGNLWLDSLPPWDEESWVGREIAIGPVRLRVDEPIGRCRATEAGPAGRYDLPTLVGLRQARGHTDFGVYATVLNAGRLSEDAACTLP